ncbi:FUSC family protein [Amycolatopsis rhizosphaerae]|uniref:FUSC family protein n=1 Tax=Amycolatopsis rhizosphaerae TaxID=2053003 RepID=A0A558DPR2_9PSEU|nr:FUSC family protein [Amycolatopsis rhizosphaerae]TVT62958.1 FUSC family protein [Amycolatopsis rhizosphaerae]
MNFWHRHRLGDALTPAGWWRLRPLAVPAAPTALRAMVGANIVLAVVVLAGHAEWAPAAAFGGMTAVHARFEPHAIRARLLAWIGAGLTLCVALGSAAGAARWGPLPVVILVALVAAVAKLLTDAVDAGPPGGLMFVFAVATMSVLPGTWTGVAAQTGVAALGAAVAWATGLAGWLFSRSGHQKPTAWRAGVRAALRRSSHEFGRAAKVGLGVFAAGLAAQLLHLGHPYWTMIAAAAVLQSTHLRHTVHRTVQRVLGTLAGAVIAALLLAAALPLPVKLACVVIALLGAELTVIRNYALAMLFVTPLTLLLGSLLAQGSAFGTASDRVLDTALGAVIGLVAALVRPGRGYHTAAA